MHPHHKAVLLKARLAFRKARNDMQLKLNAYEVARNKYHAGMASDWSVNKYLFKMWHTRALARIQDASGPLQVSVARYLEAGEVLNTVDRLLANA